MNTCQQQHRDKDDRSPGQENISRFDCNNTTSIAVSHDYSPAIIWDGMARFTMAELKDSFRIEPSAFLSASS